MAVNIGPKIGIEGEAEYRKEINKIITQTKTLKSDMAALESSFNKEASAQDKARAKSELLTKAVETQKDRVKEVANMYELSKKQLGENDEKTLKWKQALNTATIELNKTEQELAETNKVADGYEEAVDEATDANKGFSKSTEGMFAAGKLKDTFNETAEAMRKLAKAGIDAAKELDEGYDAIITKTGATGRAFDEMRSVADGIFGTMPVEMAEVGAAVGEVNTRFKQSGAALRQTSEDFLRFAAINSTDVSTSIDSTDRLMKIFGLDASQTGKVLGLLTKASQNTGISVDKLMGTLDSNGATFRELGFGLEASTSLLAEFEANGVDTSGVMTALRKSVINASKSGKSANEMLADSSERIKNASSDTEALQIATEVFGTKGAVVMAQGLRSGRINLNELSGSLENYGDVVAKTYEATLDPWDKTQVAIQNVKRAGSELAGNALSALEPAIKSVGEVVQKLADGFDDLPEGGKKVAGVILALASGASIAGPKILAVVNTVKELQVARQVASGVQALSSATTGAAVAQKGLNAAMLASPIGAVALAVTGLVAGIVALKVGYEKAKTAALEENKALAESVEATEKATSAMEEAGGKIKTVYDDANYSIAEVMATSERGAAIVDDIEKLNKAEKLNAEQKALMQARVSELNALYPTLNAQIDESTGKTVQSTQEIRNLVTEAANMQKVELYNKIMADSMEALADAYKAKVVASTEAERAEKEMNAADAERAGHIQRLQGEIKNLTGAEKELKEQQLYELSANEGRTLASQKAAEATRDAAKADEELTKQIDKLNEFQSAAQKELGITQQDIDKYNLSIEDTTDATGEYVDATNEATEATEEAGEQYGETTEEIDEYSKEIIEAYNSAAKAAKDSAVNQKTMFEQLETAEEKSLSDMAAGLQSHIDALSNWNSNVDTLINSTEYKTDEGFRAMVNTIVAAGPEMSSELQAITTAFETGDAQLQEIVSGYGDLQRLGEETGKHVALAATEAEYGIADMNAAFRKGGITVGNSSQYMVDSATRPLTKSQLQRAAREEARATVSTMSRTLNSNEPSRAVTKSLNSVSARNEGLARQTGRGISDAYGSGIQDGNGGIQTSGNKINTTTQQAIQTIGSQKGQAQAAGRGIAQAVSSGIQQGSGQVKFAINTIKTTVNSGVTGIRSLSNTARSAGTNIANGIVSGVNGRRGALSAAMTSLRTAVNSGITAIGSMASAARSRGTTIAQNVASGINAGKGGVQNAAKALGQSVSAGLNSSTGSAKSAAQGVANAAKQPLSSLGGQAQGWGYELGRNFATGIANSRPSAIDEARKTALAVSYYLKHSTPKLGPLHDDNVWGYHLGQNFAQGMTRAIPVVEAATAQMANAAVLPVVDTGVVSGAYASAENALTTDMIFDAFSAAMDNLDIGVTIGSREFGRILREYGAIA